MRRARERPFRLAGHASRRGEFTRKAKRAGRSVQAHARFVLAHPGRFSRRTWYQAQAARKLKKIAQRRRRSPGRRRRRR